MTRKQTLHHFNLACGVLPDDTVDEPVIGEETPAPFIPHPLDDDLDVLPSSFGDLIAQDDLPPTPSIQGTSPDNPYTSGPPIYEPPFTGGLTPGGGYPGGNYPGGGTTLPPETPGTPEVPEPASFVLLLTGMAGAAGAIRHRFRA